jgi:hypothetical protein
MDPLLKRRPDMQHSVWTAVAAFSTLLPTLAFGAASVGSAAPEVKPSIWLNGRGPVDWGTLKGRVVLVERWATT